MLVGAPSSVKLPLGEPAVHDGLGDGKRKESGMLKKIIPLAVVLGLAGAGLTACAEQEREFEGGGGGEVEMERDYNPLQDETETEIEREQPGNVIGE